jgi:hypothetical protein
MLLASDKEQDFYKYFGIKPLCLLSDCQYFNESHYGISYGDDVCETAEIISNDNISYPFTDFNCEKDCKKVIAKTPYYPPITDDVIVNLLLVCGTIDLDLTSYRNKEHKEKILDYVTEKTKDSDKKALIRNLLVIHIQEYKGY